MNNVKKCSTICYYDCSNDKKSAHPLSHTTYKYYLPSQFTVRTIEEIPIKQIAPTIHKALLLIIGS